MVDYKLSVIVLVYNTEEYLMECLDSIVNQTLNEIEIIIVNDESPDNSHVIVEEYHKKYRNIKVINQPNSGGAIAGNNGILEATGEYVTIMDSDDIVPLDAYEKLYQKAMQKDADIAIGSANLLVNGHLKELTYKKEMDVWRKERSINNLLDFPDIFYDGFYWNKIYKREFLIDNDCLMPPGMLYADRPMVQKAFLYASKIEIITDVVYLWRKREINSAQKSITQLKTDIDNFMDRMESLHYQINYFEEFGNQKLTEEFLKRNIERLMFPLQGILESDTFKHSYIKETQNVFKRINHIHDNDLGVTKNLYIYMILNNMIDGLIYYLTENPNGPIVEERGIYYWALPFFRDESTYIPDHLFKIDVLLPRFINIEKIIKSDEQIVIENITIPKVFKSKVVKAIVQSRNDIGESHEFCADHINKNFCVNIDITSLNTSNTYDIYLYFEYDDCKERTVRISSEMLDNKKNMINDKENFQLYFTKNQLLSIVNKKIEIDGINLAGKKIDLHLLKQESEEKAQILIRDRQTKNDFYFKQIDNEHFELKLKHFIDPNRTYDFYYRINNNLFRLSSDQIKGFKKQEIKYNRIYTISYMTNKKNLSLQTFDQIRYKLKKARNIF